MKNFKSVLILVMFSLFVNSCTSLDEEYEESQIKIESVNPTTNVDATPTESGDEDETIPDENKE